MRRVGLHTLDTFFALIDSGVVASCCSFFRTRYLSLRCLCKPRRAIMTTWGGEGG